MNQDSGFADEGWSEWARSSNKTSPKTARMRELEAENNSLRYEVSRLGMELSIIKSEKVSLQKEIDRLHARIMMSQQQY